MTDTLTFQYLARYAVHARETDGFLLIEQNCPDSKALCGRPFRSEVFCILLCTRGEISVSVDLNRYDIRRNTLSVIRPGSKLMVHTCRNFAVRCIVFDPAIQLHTPIPASDVADLRLKVMQNPVLHLAAGERLRLRRLFFAFHAVAGSSLNSALGRIALQHAIAVLLYSISDLLQRKAQPRPGRSAHTRKDEYFCRFLHLLSQYFMLERSVAFYAEKMNLTPKYLTTVIREVSGKTASECIDDIVVQEACHRLSSGGHSIQQIAYSLNFPNQSFFGVFFKNKTGISPSSYRLKNTNRC